MGDRSQMNFYPAPNRFSYGTPKRPSPYSPGPRQPLYIHPSSSPHLSPRFRQNRSDSEMSSPDFIPLGFSSPRNHNRKGNSWNNSRKSFTNRSSNSSFTSPGGYSSFNSPGSYSSFNQSSFGSQRRSRGSFHNSSYNSGSSDISLYCDKSMLEDPWAELEERVKKVNEPISVDTDSSASSDVEIDIQEETGSGASNDGEEDDDDDDTVGDNKDDSSS